MDLKIALTMDVLLLILSIWCVCNVSERSIFNPSIWWVALHTYTVTFRLITLNLGIESLPILGVESDSELVNAAIASDISLIGVLAATIFATRTVKKYEQLWRQPCRKQRIVLDPRIGQIISVLCIVLGTYALLKFGNVASAMRARGRDISAIDIGQLETSAYPIAIAGFAVQGALVQTAMRGFTVWRTTLLAVLVILTSVNLPRTSFVLALLMAFLIYQTRHNKTNISPRWIAVLVPLALVWFVYKPIAATIQQGGNAIQAIANGSNYFQDSIRSHSLGDMEFLDMQASYMAASDAAGKRFYGATLFPLLYLPIPRYTWPDKPRMNDWGLELASSQRPFEAGMVPTLSGEAYVNFGWLGSFALPFLYILLLHAGYKRVKVDGISSAERWLYLIFLVTMIQVFRDGIESFFTYPLIAYFPLTAWALVSKALGGRNVQARDAIRRPVMRPIRMRSTGPCA